MKETIIEVHDYCLTFGIDINGEDFKDHKDRKGFIKGMIDDMEDCELEHILQSIMHHHPDLTEEKYESDSCEQCGDNNIYEKYIVNKKI